MPAIETITRSEDGVRTVDVGLAQRGDVDAFARIYQSTAPRVYAVCRRMAGDDSLARELLQDVFVRAWERLAQFRGDSSLETWLHRLAVNVVIEHLRRSKREALRLVSADDDLLVAGNAASSLETRIDLATALDQLPEGARSVLVLYDIEGYSHDEIAVMLGIAAGTSRTQLWRARRAITRLLNP